MNANKMMELMKVMNELKQRGILIAIIGNEVDRYLIHKKISSMPVFGY